MSQLFLLHYCFLYAGFLSLVLSSFVDKKSLIGEGDLIDIQDPTIEEYNIEHERQLAEEGETHLESCCISWNSCVEVTQLIREKMWWRFYR